MIAVNRSELPEGERQSLAVVESCLSNSHCPHSGLCVAAGLILEDGRVVTGVNYESASYGLTLCAERTAIARAQAEGSLQGTTALIISARYADSGGEPFQLTPCGACRQWLAELSQRLGKDFPVYCFWDGIESGLQDSAQNLLPKAFL
jgi:cytidine deaminase